MNFSELKQIIEHLVNNVTCPNCEHGYNEEQLNIVGITPDEVLFLTSCGNCETQVVINVTLVQEQSIDDMAQKIHVQTKLAPQISENDFLDVKNFLNHFNGDFKALFS